MNLFQIKNKKYPPAWGIEPGSAAWQPDIIPTRPHCLILCRENFKSFIPI